MDNGLSLKESTKDFVKLRAAMGGKYTLDETKQAFESLTKAGVVLQLSQEDMAGTVKAVSQMFGKQQIMAEELKNQLTLAA
jgi:glycine cleavage system regulatory protein